MSYLVWFASSLWFQRDHDGSKILDLFPYLLCFSEKPKNYYIYYTYTVIYRYYSHQIYYIDLV